MSKSIATIVKKKSNSKESTLVKKKSKSHNENTPDDTDSQLENNFESKKEDIMRTLKEINILTKKVTMDLKQLESMHKKELKLALKTTTKKSGKQSGFNEAVSVPEPLQKLLGLDDKPLSRSRVTKLMYEYIKENKLYSPKTKRIIIPNKKMRIVFGIKKNDVMKFENFQTWLKKVYNENDKLILDIND